MPQGIEVFDGTGTQTFTTHNRITRYVGQVWTGVENGSISHGGLSGGAVWWALLPRPDNSRGSEPLVSVSGSTINWWFEYAPDVAWRVGVTIVFGVY